MLKKKNPNKLIIVLSFLLFTIFVISIFFSQKNDEGNQIIKLKLITSVSGLEPNIDPVNELKRILKTAPDKD